MDSTLIKPIGNGTTEPTLVPDRLYQVSYNWPASVHDRIARLADARHISRSKMALALLEPALQAAEAQP